jgi:hypothetical protein
MSFMTRRSMIGVVVSEGSTTVWARIEGWGHLVVTRVGGAESVDATGCGRVVTETAGAVETPERAERLAFTE